MTFWDFADKHWFVDIVALVASMHAVAEIADAIRRRRS